MMATAMTAPHSAQAPAALTNGMRLECGVGFRQLRTCRRTRPGQLWGQMQTHAPQQGDLFDHLVGAGNKGVRNLKAKRLGRLEIEIRSTARRL
jgi:hypothetical protein